MKDLHNHSLYGIDDGAQTFEDSILILNKLEDEGVKEIVLTPHYIIGTSYNANKEKREKRLKELQSKTNIKLYLGNEVFLDNDILDYIDRNEISTINGSRYILIEFSLREKMPFDHELVFNLRKVGLVPIIAHPERYSYYSIKDLEKFIEEGCLLQGNITSLMNKYGKKVKKRLIKLLKANLITVLGTDTHSNNNINIEDCLKELKKIVPEDKYNKLIDDNFTKIVNNISIRDDL